MGRNSKTHDWTMYIEWETQEYSALSAMSLSKSIPQSAGIYIEKEVEKFRSPRWWMTPRKHCLLYTMALVPMWTHRLCQHAQVKPDKISGLRVQVNTNPTTNKEVIRNWYLLGKKISVFSKGVTLGKSTILSGRTHTLEQLTNRK